MTAPLIEIQRTRSPRPRPNTPDLGFGRYFTDHMFLMDFDPARGGWHSPRIVPYGPVAMDPAAGALHYAQTIFDGLKAFPDQNGEIRVFRLDAHLARLNESAKKLCVPQVDVALVSRAIRTLLAVDASWMPEQEGTSIYIRPIIWASEGFLGVRPAKTYTLCVILSPVGSYYASGAAPVKIWVEEKLTRAAVGGLGAAKTGANYAASLRAAEEAKARGYAQVLWLDAKEHRWLEEVGTMNLFLRIGDEVITPPLTDETLLPGITRASVLELLREWGVRVSERKVSLDEIKKASAAGQLHEVFGTGTAAVISPVGELGYAGGSIRISEMKPDSIAMRLRQAISDIHYGRVQDRHGWMTRVETLESAA
ncbi:MAG: branched-chain amino acid aminotransferase [Myxococcaceae bacterium]|nr:branched-chain amino acid aminotransferase [Myxococcaceae bacterium]